MKNYTITVNGNVYDVVVEEGASTGAASAFGFLSSFRWYPDAQIRLHLRHVPMQKR